MRTNALLLSGLAVVLFACSSEAPSGSARGATAPAPDKDKDNDNDDGTATTPGTSTGTTPGSSTNPTEPAPTAGSCGSAAKMDACYECCGKAHPASVEKLETGWMACACAADKCGTQCAQSVCGATPKDPAQGDACDTCLQAQGQACEMASFDACEADATCKKLFECEVTSKCDSKPE